MDSRLNIIKEKQYSRGGDLSAYYIYTYDANDNVLTKISCLPDGTEARNQSFTYYENGTKKTETDIVGGSKEIFEYNESGSKVSSKSYYNDKPQEAYTYEYYAEGPLAKKSHNCYYSDGSSSFYNEKDYDRQGRMQKETITEKNPDGTLSFERVDEYAADGSYTVSFKWYEDGKLTSKSSETYKAQNIQVNGIFYSYSDGEVESVIVKNYDDKGRMVSDSQYDADEETLRNATVYTYVETAYGYEKTIEKLDAHSNVVGTECYMCDANGGHLGSKLPTNDGGFVMSWTGGEYKNENQSWYYTAEGKLYKKVTIRNGIKIAVSEYDENGKETKLEYDKGKDEWVNPSAGSGSGESGSGESGGDALTSLLGNDEEGNGIKLIKEESGNEVKPSEGSGTGESGNGESDESGNGVPSESGSDESDESGNGESDGDAFTTVSGNDIAGN